MHRTKREARQQAWSEAANPFARHRPRRNQSVNSRAEMGLSETLSKVQTDDDYRHTDAAQRRDDFGLSENDPVHSSTIPSARSQKREHEAGDDIQIPQSGISPRQSLSNLALASEKPSASAGDSEKHHVHMATAPELSSGPSNSDGPKHRKTGGFKDWLHRDSEDPTEDSKFDDNGKSKPNFTFVGQLRATLFNSWINLLLVFCPIGIALHFTNVKPAAKFVVNFIAIIPLAGMLSYATEEISLRVGEVLGGLLNASFGNAVELIVSIIALVKNQVLIVQTSLIGSMLSNLLLVMGMCFFFGGFNRMEQAFNMTVAQTASSLLFLAVSALIIPTAFEEWADNTNKDKTDAQDPAVPGVAPLSRGTAIMLLIVYAAYLFFQLKSHKDIYNKTGDKNQRRDMSKPKQRMKSLMPGKVGREARSRKGSAQTPPSTANSDDDNDEPEQPQLSLWVAIFTLAASTALVAINAEFLVDAINDITCGGAISKSFVGLILLPIVGNAAEHTTALTVAIKDKMDLAIGVAIGSSMQIALLVLPFVVVLGWILGNDMMTLYFDGFQIAVLFVAVLLVNYLIQDGKSHWLEGVLLMTLYIIIAVAAWFYPTSSLASDCPT